MKKKIQSCLVTLLTLIGLGISNAATAAEIHIDSLVNVNGINYRIYKHQDYWNNSKQASVCKSEFLDYTGNITIPDSIKVDTINYPVLNIGESAFKDCTELTSITLPKTLRDIGQYAFQNCLGIKKVIIPEGVTTINYGAFDNCSGLESVTLPQTLENLDGYTFHKCTALNSINIPEKVTRLRYNLFHQCSSLENVQLPSKLTYIESYCFQECTSLKSIVLPATVQTIDYRAFGECSQLKKVYIEDLKAFCTIDITEWGANPLNNGADLYLNNQIVKNLVIPETVGILKQRAFEGCTSIETVSIPNSVKIISTFAFYSCRNLKKVELPASIRRIEEHAFEECHQLKSTHIQDFNSFCAIDFQGYNSNPMSYGCDLYLNDQLMETITLPNTLTRINKGVFTHCTSIKSLTLPEGLERIGSEAFAYCSNLNKVYLPTTLSLIESDAFMGCDTLQETHIQDLTAFCKIKFQGGYSNPLSAGSSLYIKDQLANDIVLPDNLTEVKSGVFNNCPNITSVVFPKNLRTIGDYAFNNCRQLNKVVFSDALDSIGAYSFAQCNIDSINIPVGLSHIGYHAFDKAIRSVNVSNLTAFLNIELKDSCSSPLANGAQLYVNNQLQENVVIPSDVTTIKPFTFSNANGIKGVTLHKGITKIGKDAFSCTKRYKIYSWSDEYKEVFNPFIQSVDIEDLSAFCKIEFENAYSNPLHHHAQLNLNKQLVEELNIPADITKIKNYAFYGIDGLKKIIIPEKIDTIGTEAFGGNSTAAVVINAVTPPSINSDITNGVIIVPAQALATYQSATKWSNWKERIYPNDVAFTVANVKAESVASGLHRAVGEENLTNIFNLKIVGSINGYDIMLIRNKMHRLKQLDLSEADIVGNEYKYFEQYNTEDDIITPYAFHDLQLNTVILPKSIYRIEDNAFKNIPVQKIVIPENVEYIGYYAFNNCNSLESVTFPSSLQTIGANAFLGCNNLRNVNFAENQSQLKRIEYQAFADCHQIKNLTNLEKQYSLRSIEAEAFRSCYTIKELIFPENLINIGNTAFNTCQLLEKVTFPKELEEIGSRAFAGCSQLKEIKLPQTLERIGDEAFASCNGLKDIRIPSSVKYIGNEAFARCSHVDKVYTYTIEPTEIQRNTFDCWHNATLYVPMTSYYTYYYDTQWSQFAHLVEFDEPYDYFYLNGDYTLDETTGRVDGCPNVEMNMGSGFIVEGTDAQVTDTIEVRHDGKDGGSIIADNNLEAKSVIVNIFVDGGRWYFLGFPFDIPLTQISCAGTKNYVFREYDGKKRAEQGFGGWKDMEGDVLKAAKGYIFQCEKRDTLRIELKGIKFDKDNKFNKLEEFVSNDLQNASWNFTSNPFLCYYNLKDLGYDAPITIWNGNNYEAYSATDDDYILTPFEAFFVQKPKANSEITFDGQKKYTHNQSNEVKKAAAAKRALMKTNPSRLLTHIVISDGDESDQTRIVFNDLRKMDYELECDAAKFISSKCCYQIYSLDNNKARYSINERPNAEGAVDLGYISKKAGKLTISASRMDAPMYLRDNEKGVTFDLSLGAYTFTTEAGTFNQRFSLLKNNEPTSIEDLLEKTGIEISTEFGQLNIENSKEAKVSVYNAAGQLVAEQIGDGSIQLQKGNYIVKIGGLSAKVSMK